MKGRNLSGVAAAALGVILATALAFTQSPPKVSQPPTEGPAVGETPAWFLQGSFPDPTGRTIVDEKGNVTVPARSGGPGSAGRGIAAPALRRPCLHAVAHRCAADAGASRAVSCNACNGSKRWATPSRTRMCCLQVSAAYPQSALDSKGNLWVFQRAEEGKPQLFKFDPNHKIILQVGPDVIGYQEKAHGMAVDPEDNVWITAAGSSTVMKISPEGKLLLTLGQKGRRGDWDEAKGQRLLWEPVMVAFAPNGDVYIGEGHANESPNDTGLDDPANNIGAARIIHVDKNGKFKNQWFGNEVGQGKFSSAHGLGVDPTNGDVWIGDREEYRIVVYSGEGKFLRTMQLTNLVCAIHFDPQGNPWMGSGQDGQFLKLTRDGKVIGAIGNGMGIGPGQFIEASYWVFDKQNNLYAGDTSVGRVTKMMAPKK